MSALAEAKDFLVELLDREGPLPAKSVLEQARAAGIAERTLQRAKGVQGIRPTKVGYGDKGQWLWSLPTPPSTAECEDAHTEKVAILDESGHLSAGPSLASASDDNPGAEASANRAVGPKVAKQAEDGHPQPRATYAETLATAAADAAYEPAGRSASDLPALLADPDHGLLRSAAREVGRTGAASRSLLRNRLKVDEATADSLLAMLETAGVVGPDRGAVARDLIAEASQITELVERFISGDRHLECPCEPIPAGGIDL